MKIKAANLTAPTVIFLPNLIDWVISDGLDFLRLALLTVLLA